MMKLNYKVRATTALLAWLLLPFSGLAQEDTPQNEPKRYEFLRINYHIGSVLPTNEFLNGENSTGEAYTSFHALNFEYGKQTDGRRLWERIHNFPSFGVGFYTLDFLNGSDELGYPNAIYGFLQGPFRRWKKWTINYELGFGLSWNWNPFTPDLNPWNTAIGSYSNVYIDIGANVAYQIGRRWMADLGVSFTHFSNGASSVPNAGVNLVAPKIGVRYLLKEPDIKYEKGEIPDYDDNWEVYFFFAGGSRNVKLDTTIEEQKILYFDESNFMGNFTVGFMRQLTHKSKAGIVMDINYDGNLETDARIATGDPAYNVPVKDRLALGLFAGYEFVVSALSIHMGMGYEIIRNNDVPGRAKAFYQRAGLKYHFLKSRDMFGGIAIRAVNFSSARYIEWSMGYRLRWNKSGKVVGLVP